MRLVDADALKSAIQSDFDVALYKISSGDAEFLQFVLDDIDDSPAIDPAKHGRWISVEDRLPEIKEHHVSDTVLVWCANEELMAFTELEETFFGGVIFGIERPLPDDDERPEVTHWMPLPEPPTEKEAT